jgi:hypothetical protein
MTEHPSHPIPGEDVRDILQVALEWWEKQLTEIDESIIFKRDAL